MNVHSLTLREVKENEMNCIDREKTKTITLKHTKQPECS